MLGRFAAFEFRYQLLSPMFVVTSLVFLLLGFGMTAIPEVGALLSPTANINSPFTLSLVTLSLSFYGVFIPTAFLSNVVLRDRQFATEALFFTRPVTEFDYLAGRFIGAFAVCLIVFAMVPIGAFVGAQAPWLDPERLGPVRPLDYVYALFVLGAPNLLIPGALMFTVANLTRSMMATYTALVVFLALYLTGSSLLTEPALRTVAAMLDPFGMNAFTEATRYWSPVEQNTRLAPLGGLFLWNRLLWLGVAIGLLAFNAAVFSFRARGVPALQFRRKRAAAGPIAAGDIVIPRAAPAFGPVTALRQFLARLRFEILAMVRSVTFWVLIVLGIFMVLVALLNMQLLYGTPVLPVSRVVIELAMAQFSIVPLVVVIYFASELVWRDRGHRGHEILDATPTPSWAFVFSKLAAMWLVIAALFGVALVTAMVAQVVMGPTRIDPGLYLRELLLGPYNFYLIATLSIFLQVIANNRYLGMLLMVGYMIARPVMGALGFQHNLYMFGGAPGAPYSDLNGYGHFLTGRLWFLAYWTLFAGMLVVLTQALWSRGALTPIWRRVAALPRRLTRGSAAALGGLAAAFALTGGFIFYNTNILNEYRTSREGRLLQVQYEERYRQYETLPQPRVTDIGVEVDIYPDERRYDARGTYTLENTTDAPIARVHLDYGRQTIIGSQSLDGATLEEADEEQAYYIFALDTPMQPGETRTLEFAVARENPGFRNGSNASSVVGNGSFVNKAEALPQIGFNRGKMLQERAQRRRRGLEPVDRLAKLEDEAAARRNYITPDSAWVEFEAVVSTAPDQIAIAPGTLMREWEEGGRRYFHYRMETPILNFYAFLSADYEVVEERRDGVLLQVFHDAEHAYNVPRMIEAMGEAIEYFSAAFSPFQHRQMRIFEFPHFFGSFAQSFPNSVPYSEAAGFIMDNRDPEKIDYVYYITAHEVAHQWWAHQLVGGAMQGATMLSETFSQYSALMLMEKEFGDHHIRRFLRYELDNYLSQRGGETIEELPLYRVENQQYIHYNKGSVVMYALKDYLSEATVNRALSRFLDEYAYQSDPYPRSTDFLRILREEAGPEHDTLIADLFEKIVLFDLRTTETQVTARADGRFDVRLTVEAKKLEADGEGTETEAPLDYMIDIGLFSEHPEDVTEGDDHVILLEKRSVRSGENVFEFTVDRAPVVAGIDPYNKLIDRAPGDNLRDIDARDDADSAGAGDADPGDAAADEIADADRDPSSFTLAGEARQ